MADLSNLLKLPATNLSRVMRLKKAIHDDLQILSFIGGPFDAELLQSFADALMPLLPDGILRKTVVDSCVYLTCRPVTIEEIKMLAWRLAGNIPRLMSNKPVHEWSRQERQEWMPLQVVDYRINRNYKHELVAEYTVRVLAGSGTGMLVKRTFDRRMCYAFARDLGFPKRRNSTGLETRKTLSHFKDFSDLVGMRLFGLFDPALGVTTLKFWHVACSSSFRNYNRNIMKLRARIGFTCPKGYTHTCNKCPIGYDQCPAATHPRTYQLQTCSSCNAAGWFDSKQSEDLCVDCLNKSRTNQEPKD